MYINNILVTSHKISMNERQNSRYKGKVALPDASQKHERYELIYESAERSITFFQASIYYTWTGALNNLQEAIIYGASHQNKL